MKSFNLAALSFVLVTFFSCGTGANVQTVKKTNKDLSMYNTFAYLPNTNVEVPGESYNDEEINTVIIETINRNMRQAGYNLDRDNPDLLVLASASTDLERQTTREPVYATYPYSHSGLGVSPFYSPYYYRGYSTFPGIIGYTRDSSLYEEGTLVIKLVDRENREVVWKGVASENIYNQSNTAAIQELVNEIFDEYPLNNDQ